ncbi:hypothetical protein CEXT_528441 [Caerostris extrusa]|uniref:Uncharacterized protein n=1 Tax=Caerostris extrusa TaxID=172846 RepID=A0AAV4V942_CAEEX|nr:hypothetical protein CEXT_528441 [Caerostris extrusa]
MKREQLFPLIFLARERTAKGLQLDLFTEKSRIERGGIFTSPYLPGIIVSYYTKSVKIFLRILCSATSVAYKKGIFTVNVKSIIQLTCKIRKANSLLEANKMLLCIELNFIVSSFLQLV